jgi:catechol 2,3-dioxygenase-like lactoylglutathione lyase family enzyme
VQLFHYHLVTSRVREVEARYLAKLGFELVARYGRVGEEHRAYESGVSWEELDQVDFKLRLSELERGAVNVVVQPGQWDLPRVDHIGLVLDDEDFAATLARAEELNLRVQEHGARRTFIAVTPNTCSTAWRICVLCALGCTLNVYLRRSAMRP